MRLIVFYLLLIAMQGFLATLIAPLPAPDLFLLGVLTLLWRLPPWQLVLIAYGVGVLQDVIGFGLIGMHGLGLAGAVLLASIVRAQLSQLGLLERALIIFSALVGKWLVFAGLLLWLSGSDNLLVELARVAPLEIVFTVVVGLWLLPFATLMMERSSVLRKELL